jgi:hypothetical protein
VGKGGSVTAVVSSTTCSEPQDGMKKTNNKANKNTNDRFISSPQIQAQRLFMKI